jgi:hypothetical protein
MPNNRGETVKELLGPGPLKRVLIIKRADGCYAIRPERWYQSVFEGTVAAEGWKPLDMQSGLFASSQLAERDALATFPWLVR